jgi:hypothetical protein
LPVSSPLPASISSLPPSIPCHLGLFLCLKVTQVYFSYLKYLKITVVSLLWYHRINSISCLCQVRLSCLCQVLVILSLSGILCLSAADR